MSQRWLAFALAVLPAAQVHSQHRRHAEQNPGQAALSLDAAAVNAANQPQIQQGAKGAAVLRAQILLARAHFSCGEIDGSFGTNLLSVVRAFQQEHGVPASGVIDGATWGALGDDHAPALTTATIAPEDVQGPFIPIPADLMEQASLPALGYASPLEGLSERFHASPEVMRALNPGADFHRAGQQLTVPNVLTMPPGAAAKVVVSKAEGSVRTLDGTGKTLSFYVATTGSEHDPLPLGEWTILGVARNPEFHYDANLFWDAKNAIDKATIQPGPNNPVGVVWIALSIEHYGIHGTPQPGKVGHAYSHGCIRLTNWDATELASMVKPDIQAILQE